LSGRIQPYNHKTVSPDIKLISNSDCHLEWSHKPAVTADNVLPLDFRNQFLDNLCSRHRRDLVAVPFGVVFHHIHSHDVEEVGRYAVDAMQQLPRGHAPGLMVGHPGGECRVQHVDVNGI